MTLPDSVRTLERDLREIFGGRLQSLLTYGTTPDAGAHGGGHSHHRNLIRTMAIAQTLTADDLRAVARRAAGWRDAGLAAPILLAAHEFEDSLDAFPLEFGAILAGHTVIAGANPFNGAKVDPADVRRACEVQARSHLLHLRQGYVDAHDNGNAIAVLIIDSAAAFAGLLESFARLQGIPVHDADAVARYVERTIQAPDRSVADVLALTQVAEISSAAAIRIFPAYLDAVERLVKFVDTWSAA